MARTRRTKRLSAVDHFMTYTTFKLALDDPAPGIDKASDEWTVEEQQAVERWEKYLTPLVTAEGHRSSVCARKIEQPEEVLLLTGGFKSKLKAGAF